MKRYRGLASRFIDNSKKFATVSSNNIDIDMDVINKQR